MSKPWRLYIFWFLHQTTTSFGSQPQPSRCISFDSYIKPQLSHRLYIASVVVYLLIPTSNHNYMNRLIKLNGLYIFWFLHQTTTELEPITWSVSCISFDSYIKPQPAGCIRWKSRSCISFDSYIKPQRLCCAPSLRRCCISFDSYIKPQLMSWSITIICVVYLLIPTSNHNDCATLLHTDVLYIFWFLHQTTTLWRTHWRKLKLYIFWFLHQTTTLNLVLKFLPSCISFDSYIKPQLLYT